MVIERLKKEFGLNNFRLESSKYFSKNNLLKVVFITDEIVSEETRLKILNKIEAEAGVPADIKIRRNVKDADAIKQACLHYLRTHMASVANFLKLDDISVETGLDVKINFLLNQTAAELFKAAHGAKKLEEFIKENFFCSSKVSVSKKAEKITGDVIEDMQKQLLKNQKEQKQKAYFILSGHEKYIGEHGHKTADLIEDCQAGKSFCLCGEIDYLTIRTFNKKTKAGVVEKEYLTFVLRNNRGRINCTFFGSKAHIKKLTRLARGTKICAHGFVDVFAEKLSFKPKTIMLIENFVYKEPDPVFKDVQEEFVVVVPQASREFWQTNMFEDVQNQARNKAFKKRRFVVFDFETTGLSSATDKIIEIGAVRIENGDIKETFSTLINPGREITEEITKITGICNQMVKDAPTICKVIGDFYKFCYDCELVAYNSSFDMGFLHAAAMANSYYFDNKVIDALALARKANHGTNNHELSTVLDRLKIKNDSAHRALSDALATAKLFIHLADEGDSHIG